MESSIHQHWNINLESYECDRCHWRYLVTGKQAPARCPYCTHAPLMSMEAGVRELPGSHKPELLLPYSVKSHQLETGIENFAGGIPFRPHDLNPENLFERIERIFIPMWLVDSHVEANWQAEFGFDYQVVSHQDQYEQNRGGWRSRQIEETRVRWEPRLGHLERIYHNVIAPALEGDREIKTKIGAFDTSKALPYSSLAVADSFIRLPDREPQDAWQAARPAYQKLAAEECRRAGQADHIRQFSWKPEFSDNHWTMLLLPVYSTYYVDDGAQPQRILVNGQSGKLYGARRGAMKRAQRTSLWILLAAVILFFLSVGLSLAAILLPVILAVGVLIFAVSLIVGLGALTPVVTVWWFNRQQPH